MNALTAYALARGLGPLLEGRTVESASRFAGGMTVEFSGRGRRFVHLLSAGRESEILAGGDRLMPEEVCSPAFVDLVSARVLSVEPLGLDRVILMRFEEKGSWGEGGRLTLRIDLSPVFRSAALFREGTARPLETFGAPGSRPPGDPGQLPPRKRWTLESLPEGWRLETGRDESGDAERIEDHTRIWKETGELASLISRTVGGVDPVLARALASRHVSDPEGLAASLVSISGELSSLGGGLPDQGPGSGSGKWRIYDFTGSGERGICSVYPVAIPFDPRPGSPENMFEVLDARNAEKVIPAFTSRLRREASRHLRRSLKKAKRMLANVAGDLESARRSGEMRHIGNLLVTWRHRLRTGMASIRVTDFDGEEELEISLDPALDPERNIQSYFRRAKKGEKGLAVITARQGHIREEIAGLEERIAEIESTADPAALASVIIPPKGVRRSNRADRQDRSAPRFKSYRIDSTHTILVGRSDRENDELTHRRAAPTDLWFHAQGVPGSHVVLRGANRSTPAGVVETAAEAAAYFSKARGSGTVPVICAEKKYVRRPRGARPGTAVCQRSKTLFVTPREPGDRKKT